MAQLDPHRRLGRFLKKPRSGTAAVEFAVVLPLIIILLVGVWEAGRLIEVQQVMNNAAREGARQAAGGQMTISQVQQVVINYLTNAGVPVTNPDPNQVVTVTNQGFTGNPTPPDNNPQNATRLDRMQVTVTIPFRDVRWSLTSYFTSSATMLTSQATWSSIKDLSYPAVSYPVDQ